MVASGNTFAALAAAQLVRLGSGSDGRLRTTRDAVVLVGAGSGLGAALSATVGASAMAASGLTPWAFWGSTWAEWWIGDAMGVLVVAPLFLAWHGRPRLPAPRELMEIVALASALLVVGLLVFLQPAGAPYPLAFTLLPVSIWAAYRFETFGASVATLAVTAIAVAGTLTGHGVFARSDLSDSVRLMWGFVGVVAVTGLTLGSQVAVRARAEAALRESRDRLEQAARERERIEEGLRRSERLASLGTFAAGIAHEINNPLAAILLAAHGARHDLDEPEGLKVALDDIIAEIERSARIVKSLLKFSKAEASELSELDLRRPLGRACDHARQAAAVRGVQLIAAELDEAAPVRGNDVELEQVFANLLHNAIQASPPDGRIEVSSVLGPKAIRVSVSDSGRGMTALQQARAFEPFYTTRAGEGGTGLGLSLAHGIVEAHGGSIEFSSRPGRGTRVTVELPRSTDDPHPRS